MTEQTSKLSTLLPCPFCGRSDTLAISGDAEFHEVDCECRDLDSGYFAVMCDATKPDGPGGCGASGGFAPTQQLAAEQWNRRGAGETGAKVE